MPILWEDADITGLQKGGGGAMGVFLTYDN
jgi:hypothetical protein